MNLAKIERIKGIIFGLATSTLIPYILYVLKNVDKQNQEEIYELIETYIMRRIVLKESTKDYNKIFRSLIANQVQTKEDLKKHLLADIPNDERLKEGFHNYKLINNNTRGIIYFIESKNHKPEMSTQLLGMGQYSLEHIMPKKWIENWEKPENEESRNHKLLTLGNLAIITQSLNSKMKNNSWEIKSKDLKEYSSGITTLSEFLNIPVWNEEKIEERADYLLEKAKEVWKI